MKAYDKPEFVEVDTSETGFLIPLEGDAGKQEKFQSEGYLRDEKVATKRVQIVHRWSQEGRMPTDGRWIATVRFGESGSLAGDAHVDDGAEHIGRFCRGSLGPGDLASKVAIAWGSAWDSPAPRLSQKRKRPGLLYWYRAVRWQR